MRLRCLHVVLVARSSTRPDPSFQATLTGDASLPVEALKATVRPCACKRTFDLQPLRCSVPQHLLGEEVYVACAQFARVAMALNIRSRSSRVRGFALLAVGVCALWSSSYAMAKYILCDICSWYALSVSRSTVDNSVKA